MKTIGLIGGLSWESTAVYYKLINEQVRAHRGGLSSASLVLHSFDFAEIVRMQQAGQWVEAADALSGAAQGLHRSGAGCIAICTNTMHRVADEVEASVPDSVRLLHIGDAVGEAVRAAGFTRVGLLGTRYTMEQPFLAERLSTRHGVETVTPNDEDRGIVHHIIFGELCQGIILPESRLALERVAEKLRVEQGAEAVILGCTELMLLAGDETGDFPLPRFDTTALHARAIADYALQSSDTESIIETGGSTAVTAVTETRRVRIEEKGIKVPCLTPA
ncbi:MAG: aspartate/glutamate racemase family protein [Armatimonadota bacterium]